MRLFLILGLCLTCSLAFAAEKVASHTIEGQFNWSHQKGKTHNVKAVFTKSAKAGVYDVSFYFNWGKNPHVYTGQATGNLKDGMLKGTVKNDDKKRSFGFEGTCKNMKFEGKHHEIKGKWKTDTGTISLAPKK